ncbi:MAG TPA: ATPase, partial [Sphingomicrobium sp.]|nr:ATPase [Sphingomicrobium sp.]
LGPRFAELGFAEAEVEAIVAATGPRDGLPGFTYSDLTQRLIPGIVLDAYPERAIEPERAIAIAREMQATPAFRE